MQQFNKYTNQALLSMYEHQIKSFSELSKGRSKNPQKLSACEMELILIKAEINERELRSKKP